MNHNHFVPANGSSAGSSAVPDQGQPTGANTGSTRKPKSAGKVIDLKPKEAVRPHVKVSLEDINWVRSQPPCVQQLWLDCMAVEQFGNQQRELKTSLSSKSFRLARIALQKQKLFDFEPITKLSQSGRTSISSWKVQNLHGYYIKKYWELEVLGGETLPPERENLPASGETLPPERENLPASGETLPPERENLPEEKLKTLDIQGVDFSQPNANHVLTTHQPPTKVVGGVVGIPSEETGSPLGGSPTMRDGVKQEESPQGAPDCPTLSGGVGSDYENQSQLGAEPPDPQTQSFEAGLHGGEFHSPPRREPPLEASQGEEAVVQFLEGKAQTPISEDSLASLTVRKAADLKPQDLDGDNSSGAGAGVKNCANEPASNQDNVQIPASTVTIDVIADPEQIQQHRQWIKKNFFTRPPYPGRERLEEWLVHQLLYASPPQRDSFTQAFRTAERQRPAASLSYLIEKALPVLGQKDLKLPDQL